MENFEDLKDRGSINHRANHRGSNSGRQSQGLRGGKDALLSPLRGAGRGGRAIEDIRHVGMMMVRKQEAEY